MCARSIEEDDDEKETKEKRAKKCQSKQNREKIESGRKSWAGGPLNFVLVDECSIYFALVFWNCVLRR